MTTGEGNKNNSLFCTISYNEKLQIFERDITMKKTQSLILLALVLVVIISTGCRRQPQTIAKGTIFRVEYRLENGKTGGFTRLNIVEAVPGGNGTWNVDAYGVLTRDFLIITYPQQKEFGPRVIPTHRLVDIQFGDGGIKKIDKKPAQLNTPSVSPTNLIPAEPQK